MKLMIVESPGKVKKIKEILGDGWKVSASVGHVRDLPQKEIGVEAPDFKPTYVATERGKEVLARLKNDIKNCEAIFLATDLDREGEAIAWHLKQALRINNPQRITFSEITPKAIKTALISPRAINIPMVAAQEGRRVLDRLVGYMVSPRLSDMSGQQGLSAGRVQSPAVRIILERERAIQNFKSTSHFGVQINFLTDWFAEWDVKPFLKGGEQYFMDEEFAQMVAKVKEVEVISYEEKAATKSPPAPFITSTLQQAASNKLKMQPKATMTTAQKLYEQGHITYMRTDNPNLSDDALISIYQLCRAKNLKMADKPRVWKAKGDAQEAHEAIRPSHFEAENAGTTPEEKALYRLIWERALASQLESACFAVRSARFRSIDTINGQTLEFFAEGRTLAKAGWKSLFTDDTEDDESKEDKAKNPIPLLKNGQHIDIESGKVLNKKTRAPNRFTQASLIAELERLGIGRPSTYAAIMDNIDRRGYVTTDKEKKYLLPTETGALIIDALVKGGFSFIEYDFTREMENELDKIANGFTSYKNVVSSIHERLVNELNQLNIDIKPKYPCSKCGKAMTRRKGNTGFFWGCSGYPDCRSILPDSSGKPGKPNESKQKVSSFDCPVCRKPLKRHKKAATGEKKAYDFFGCSGFPDCKATFDVINGKPRTDKK
ncbi:type I DNA topoisomerase [Xenorhabdus sp. KK7.4]|uniref:type I DNA topoisomerase n=1 Tax=Xenorhabdus sp. KK7.4 TaxID=1851572 RepID=UPI000C039F68|nr:type I DNA topoisomerase [Xenorhabdus sp. KK7.4]PHM51279.1 DNA topoisomerase I [Xenorhabdus sp. KK7.4]